MVLPGKHTYELIYNRLGNDMLLWLPMIFSVKEHLYNELFPDPLKDPDVGFSRCVNTQSYHPALTNAGQHDSDDEDEANLLMALTNEGPTQGGLAGDSNATRQPPVGYSAFPRSKAGSLTIHTDTCVALKIRKGHVAICSSQASSPAAAYGGGSEAFVFVAQVDNLSLKTVVGLEKEPAEICLLALAIKDAKILFGSGRSGH